MVEERFGIVPLPPGVRRMHGRTWRHLVGSVRVVRGCAVRGMVVVCDVFFGRFGCVHVFGLEVVEGLLFFFFWSGPTRHSVLVSKLTGARMPLPFPHSCGAFAHPVQTFLGASCLQIAHVILQVYHA